MQAMVRARLVALTGTCVLITGALTAGCADDALLFSSSAPEPTPRDGGAAPVAVTTGDASADSTPSTPSTPPTPPTTSAPVPDAGAPTSASCATAEPPSTGLAIWLRAGAGYGADGAGNVSTWVDQAGGGPATAPSDAQRPTLVPNALNGKTALHFNGADDDAHQAALERSVPINGLTGMTIVFVNATDVLWKDDATEWCHYKGCNGDKGTQVPGARQVSETGCSGTYQHVLWWNGAPDPSKPGSAYDWSGVFLSPKQEGIGFRFGNKVKTYATNPCDIAHDENVEWNRPQSVGTRWTRTIAVHDGLVNTLYADGVRAQSLPAPGGTDRAVYAADTLDVGNGFGWVDGHNHGGLVAEVLVYTRALSEAEVTQVDGYLTCALFPGQGGDAGP